MGIVFCWFFLFKGGGGGVDKDGMGIVSLHSPLTNIWQ